jgi:hypothetical protein
MATKIEAVDHMYGGKGPKDNPMKGMTNAYMLVYFVDHRIPELTREIPLAEIPEEVRFLRYPLMFE